jgi:hypothetical protein
MKPNCTFMVIPATSCIWVSLLGSVQPIIAIPFVLPHDAALVLAEELSWEIDSDEDIQSSMPDLDQKLCYLVVNLHVESLKPNPRSSCALPTETKSGPPTDASSHSEGELEESTNLFWQLSPEEDLGKVLAIIEPYAGKPGIPASAIEYLCDAVRVFAGAANQVPLPPKIEEALRAASKEMSQIPLE